MQAQYTLHAYFVVRSKTYLQAVETSTSRTIIAAIAKYKIKLLDDQLRSFLAIIR